MANIKRIYLKGQIPFDLPWNSTHMVTKFFAYLNSPMSGLHIEYGKEKLVPNRFGGKTAMFDFCISGEEAVSWTFLNLVIKEMKEAGTIFKRCSIIDMEMGNNTRLVV